MVRNVRAFVVIGGLGIALAIGPVALFGQTSAQANAAPLKLTLDDAIQRGIRSNLAVLERQTDDQFTRIARMRALSALLPTVSAAATQNVLENNLAVFGFRFPGIPRIIGPFGYADLRAFAEADLYNRATRLRLKVAEQNIRASELSTQDARDLVVEAVANGYLNILASAARVEAAKSEVSTAQALFERAHDQHAAGVSPAIDELRSQVELKGRQQQLLTAENQFAKNKLQLAQVIGLPPAQSFDLAEEAPYAPLEGLTAEEMLERARTARADYRSLQAQLESAKLTRDAALAQRYPTLTASGNYGFNGVNQAQLHQTFTFAGSIKVNVFDGGRIHADVSQAETLIDQRKNEIADLDRRIDVEIRTALLDLKTAADQVAVAESNLDLANQTLVQARDRFAAGVTDNIEVVQAQDAVANAQESLIASRYAHNLAKVALARAVGATESNVKQFLGAK
jgi:outer membrane protein TolC